MYRKLRRYHLLLPFCAVVSFCAIQLLLILTAEISKTSQLYQSINEVGKNNAFRTNKLQRPQIEKQPFSFGTQQSHLFHRFPLPTKEFTYLRKKFYSLLGQDERKKGWFVLNGTVYIQSPSEQGHLKLFPEENPTDDRIIEQLMYKHGDTDMKNNDDILVHDNNVSKTKATKHKMKTILLYDGLASTWGTRISAGRKYFLEHNCSVNACHLTGLKQHLTTSDVVVFKDFEHKMVYRNNSKQLWVVYLLESPAHTPNFTKYSTSFNMTATYRHDSDIVTPYQKWVYYDDKVRSLPQRTNYAKGKTGKVAWFVSNCKAKNNRLNFARELGKHIQLDIYGTCGSLNCARDNHTQCFDLLSKTYKFYLAFENSNCRDYITEKFFINGLGNNVLPIVMGAHPADYKRVAPENSYIHVDNFATPKALAEYLHKLNASDELYNGYFTWKGTGEFVNVKFFCRLCAMAHYAGSVTRSTRFYTDFDAWWRGRNLCTPITWSNQTDVFLTEYPKKGAITKYLFQT